MSKQSPTFHARFLKLAALVSLSALVACGGGTGTDRTPIDPSASPSPTATPGPNDPTSKNTPKGVLEQDNFASCQVFKDYYAQSLAEEFFSGYSYDRNCFGCEPALLTPVALQQEDSGVITSAAPPPQQANNRDVTQTNTQEAGVDEADLIETNPNGTEIYVLRRAERELLVIDTADSADLQIISRTKLSEDREPTGMFFDVDNQRLAIILTPYYTIYYLAGAPGVTDAGQGAPREGKLSIAPPGDFEQGTQVQFFDVSDPASPQLQETFLGDGQYVNARRIGDRIHLITQFGFPYPAALYDDREYNQLAYEDYRRAYEQDDEAEMQRLEPLIRQKISDAVNAMAIDDLLPQVGTNSSGQSTLACDQIQRSDVNTRMGLLMINSIDTDGSALNTLGTINNSWQIYASKQSLYLLQTSGGWWFDRAQKQQTAIYRFDISSGVALPGAVGLVDGWVNNSYQLGEFEDYLRIASTEGRFRPDGGRFSQASHLSVLDISNMNTVGEVRDFIPQDVDPNRAETIRSARFLGDRGYVVTFEQTDPLFNFDLSNPTAPFISGFVEIPGFSSYIYPLSDDYLLTIGRAAGPDGVGTGRGYQLQIFDVSDPAAPASVAQEEPDLGENGYAYSTAEHQPLAFTFLETASINPLDQVNGLLSIPVQISSSDQADALSGFVAYRIGVQSNGASIDEYARIDHKDTGNGGSGCPSNRGDLPPEGCSSFAPVIYNEPLRSVIFTEGSVVNTTTLLTLSSAKLKATDATGAQAQDLDTLELSEN